MHVCISFLHFKFALADFLRADTYCFHYFGFYVLLLIYLAYRRSFFKMSWYCGIFSQKSFHAQVSCNEIYLSWVCTVLIYRCSESMRVYIEELLLKINQSFQISFIFPNCLRFFFGAVSPWKLINYIFWLQLLCMVCQFGFIHSLLQCAFVLFNAIVIQQLLFVFFLFCSLFRMIALFDFNFPFGWNL